MNVELKPIFFRLNSFSCLHWHQSLGEEKEKENKTLEFKSPQHCSYNCLKRKLQRQNNSSLRCKRSSAWIVYCLNFRKQNSTFTDIKLYWFILFSEYYMHYLMDIQVRTEKINTLHITTRPVANFVTQSTLWTVECKFIYKQITRFFPLLHLHSIWPLRMRISRYYFLIMSQK